MLSSAERSPPPCYCLEVNEVPISSNLKGEKSGGLKSKAGVRILSPKYQVTLSSSKAANCDENMNHPVLKAQTRLEEKHSENDDHINTREKQRRKVRVGYKTVCLREPNLIFWLTTAINIGLAIFLCVGVKMMRLEGLFLGITIGILGLSSMWYIVLCVLELSYFWNKHSRRDVEEILKSVLSQEPILELIMVCSHSEGSPHNPTTKVTHRAVRRLKFRECRDESRMISSGSVELGEYYLTKIKMQKRFVFKNKTDRQQFNKLKSDFIRSNSKDLHNEFSETFHLPRFEGRMLCECTEPGTDGRLPDLKIRRERGILFCALCLGPWYTLWINSFCGYQEYDIVKKISGLY